MGGLPTALAQTPPRPPSTVLNVAPRAEHLELQWSDAEDAVSGAIRPVIPNTAEPIRVTLKVGTFYGEEFRGPVTIGLRKVGAPAAQERTVPFTEGEGWTAQFEAAEAGAYELDVGFRTTRHKTVRAQLVVRDRTAIPGWLRWGALALIAAVVLAYGVRVTLKSPSAGTPTRPQ